jgi:peptidoglycan hydrolase-like protein with peptidoglycan-binding domain
MGTIQRKAALGAAAALTAATAALAATGAAQAATAPPAVTHAVRTTAAGPSRTVMLAWPMVRPGASGERVWTIQYLLNARIGARLAVDGKFGPRTTAAVKAFQRKYHLSADGIVGPQTWAKLIVVVREGNRGGAVWALQHSLRYAYGYRSVAVDGTFGRLTAAAVRSFQAKHHLAVDGWVGLATWNALVVHER